MSLIPAALAAFLKKKPGRFLLTLIIGACGAAVFLVLTAPLPWMLGPMTAVALTALAGATPFIPSWLRALVSSVIGLMLGSSFIPEMFARMPSWIPSLCGLLLVSLITTGVVTIYFRRIGRYDPVSAYFSAAPGGLSDMTIIGGVMGGNETLISLSHTIRLLTVVVLVPLWFRLSYGYDTPGVGSAMGRVMDLNGLDVIVLIGCGIVGYGAASLIRLPAPYMMGPLLLSACVHGAGLTQAHPPGELVLSSQLILGCAIGCRFSGIRWASMLRPVLVSCSAAFLMLTSNLLGIFIVWSLTDIADFMSIFLSFTPGGLAEMAMIALTLGADIAFVSAHHFVRIFSVLFFAPLVFKLLSSARRKADRR